jgi:peptidoglycan/LPS O-acetylase OafA/YrhL
MTQTALSPKESASHIPGLDGVRGLAVVMVVCYHGQLSLDGSSMAERVWISAFRGGWCGVDLFFVLSGFLITTILIQTRQDSHYFRNFFMRRVLRIFPLYFVSLFLLFSWLSGVDSSVQVWHYLFFQNWMTVFGSPSPPGILSHFWSLAVEEQFYLFWPVVIWFLHPKHVPAFCLATISLACAARCVGKWYGLPEGNLYGLTPFRLDSLAMGALVASCRLGDLKDRLNRFAPVLFSVALAGVVAIAITENSSPFGNLVQTAGYTIFAVMSGTLIAMIADGHRFAVPFRRVFDSSLLRYLGRRSYAIYIVHAPILIVTVNLSRERQLPDDAGIRDIVYFAIAVVVTIIVSELSWHILENPFLRLKRRFPRGSAHQERPIATSQQTSAT